jgi:hypothetical protein
MSMSRRWSTAVEFSPALTGIVVLRGDHVHQSAKGFDAQRQRRDIEQQEVLKSARENSA